MVCHEPGGFSKSAKRKEKRSTASRREAVQATKTENIGAKAYQPKTIWATGGTRRKNGRGGDIAGAKAAAVP